MEQHIRTASGRRRLDVNVGVKSLYRNRISHRSESIVGDLSLLLPFGVTHDEEGELWEDGFSNYRVWVDFTAITMLCLERTKACVCIYCCTLDI